jgi:undecaprenyl diphosphate synthase
MFSFHHKKILGNTEQVLPKHIAIIMDGNGRWAQKRGLPRTAGHTAGAAVFRTIVKYASRKGVQYMTVYAFSTENWSRPSDEVNALISLFKVYLLEAIRDFASENIKIQFLGDTSKFPKELKSLVDEVRELSKKQTGMVLNIAMNYGGRDEILRATQNICKDVLDNKIKTEDIDQKLFSDYLYTAGQPDPDLIIRPSGEERLSNFLLWQSAYSELVFMNIMWPDFKTDDLDRAIEIYNHRHRRFGKV